MDLTGRTFHHYQILELIEQGGMAEVYKAYHATLDCLVAVKILYPHLASQESFLRRFRQEARAIAKLHHPDIVRVQDFGVEGNLVYMVMEFIDGPSLQSCLEEAAKREEYWSLENILRLLRKAGSAIDYAHLQGMIHRDIKPGNILLRVGQPSDEDGYAEQLAKDYKDSYDKLLNSVPSEPEEEEEQETPPDKKEQEPEPDKKEEPKE